MGVFAVSSGGTGAAGLNGSLAWREQGRTRLRRGWGFFRKANSELESVLKSMLSAIGDTFALCADTKKIQANPQLAEMYAKFVATTRKLWERFPR